MKLLSKSLTIILGIACVFNVTLSMDPAYGHNVSCGKDIWYITLPTKNITLEFTSIQISNIIMTCFNEQEQAQILNGQFDLLASRLEQYDIRPDSVPKCSAIISSSGDLDKAPSLEQFQKIVNRVRENLGFFDHSAKLQNTLHCSSSTLYQLQSHGDIAGLKKMVHKLQNEKSMSREGRKALRQLIAQAQSMLEAPITHKLHQIKIADLAAAYALYKQIESQWPWCLDCRFAQNIAQKQQYVNQMGFNEFDAAQKLFYSRPDYRQQQVLSTLLAHQSKLQVLPILSTHQQVIAQHQAGDTTFLQQERENLIKHINNSVSTSQATPLQTQLKSLEDRINHPITKSLREIKTTKDLTIALAEYHNVLQAYAPDMQKTFDFCPIEAAKSLLEARADYQALQAESVGTEIDVQAFKPIDVQQEIIQSLETCPDRFVLAGRLEHIVNDVFSNVAYHTNNVFPQIKTQMRLSIDTIKSTNNPYEFAFHMTVVDHVLSDVQTQAVQNRSVLQKSSLVLTHAIKQYWKNLSPTETEISFVCDLARYVSDVTLGTNYLSPEMREQRIQAFWHSVDTLSSLSVSDFTLENVVDGSMYIAARATWAMGIGQAISVIKNIKNACAISQAVASFANKFLGVFDGIMGAGPLIGADGTVISSVSSALAADIVKVAAIAAAHEQAEQVPVLFNAQGQEQMKDNGPKVLGAQKKSGTDWSKLPDQGLLKSKRTLSKRVAEHLKKLEEFIKDPDKFDHHGFLKNAKDNIELRNKIIGTRISHLNDEIAQFNKQIADIVLELLKRGIV